MGCKCANSNEEEEEIQKKALEDGNAENTNIDFNKNFNQNEDLLGLNNQENLYQEDVQKNPSNQKETNPQNFDVPENENENNGHNIDPNAKYGDYPEKIVELINNIREDPVGYADLIEDSIKYIMEEEDKNDPTNMRLIFKKE